MKHILVPTDFSEASANAFQYAQHLADVFSASIHLVHVYHPSFDPSVPSFSGDSELISIKKEALGEFVQKYRLPVAEDNPHVSISHDVTVGFAVDELIHLSKQDDCDFVVMGSTGEHGVADKLFGSISSSVSRKAWSPVLLVPADVTFRPISRILYASNFESIEDEMIEELFEFAAPFEAGVHFVHVSEGKTDENALREEIFEEVFEQKTAVPSFQTATVYHEEPSEGLSIYAIEHEVDLISIVTHRRSFWENLLHKSTTKQLAFNTNIPMMVLHWGDKS